MKSRLYAIVKIVYNIVHDSKYKERAKMRKEDFTRNRKMNFIQTVAFIVTGIPKSIQVGLAVFLEEYAKEVGSYSKQAFSKRRLCVNPDAIKELFDATAENFYNLGKFDTLKGYRVLAVDGTKYNLPNSPELAEVYGEQITGNAPQVQALGSCLYDVMNGILIDAAICPCRSSERDLAVRHMERLIEMDHDKEILLFDRGYPSAELISELESRGLHYLMRCTPEFCHGMKPTSDDCTLTHRFARHKVTSTFRYIKFKLPNGNNEILITNLPEDEFPHDTMAELYHMRWGIETKYDELKNKINIENFSGLSDIAVRQDFYASVFLANLAGIAVFDNREKVNAAHNAPENKYVYKQNLNVTIGILREKVVEMVLVDSDRKRRKILRQILVSLVDSVVPIRDDRAFSRGIAHSKIRFPMNGRSS